MTLRVATATFTCLLFGCASGPFPAPGAVDVPAGVVADSWSPSRKLELSLSAESGDSFATLVVTERLVVLKPRAKALPRIRGWGQPVTQKLRISGHEEPERWLSEAPTELRAGDVVDRQLTFSVAAELMPPLSVAAPYSTEDVEIEVTASLSEHGIRAFRGTGESFEEVEFDGSHAYEFENVPAAFSDALAVHAQRQGPWLLFVVTSGIEGGKRVDFASSWSQVARRIEKRIAGLGAPPDDWFADLAQGDGYAQVRNLRRNTRPLREPAPWSAPWPSYDSIEAASGVPVKLVAAAATQDSNALERLLFVAAGTRSGPLVLQTVPGQYGFVTALVAVKAGESFDFLDPACMTCARGQLPSPFQRAWGLVIGGPRNALVQLPESGVELRLMRSQVSWASDRRSVSGLLEVAGPRVGAVAESECENAVSTVTRQSLDFLSCVAAGIAAPGESLSYRFDAQRSVQVRTVADILGTTWVWLDDADPALDRDYLLPAPSREESVAIVELPAGPYLEEPLRVRYENAFGSVEFEAEMSGAVLRAKRTLVLERVDVPKSRAAEFLELVNAARDVDRHVLVP